MALTAYTKFRFLWGAFDYEQDDEAPAYTSANSEKDISLAANGRRVTVIWDRSLWGYDRVQTHFDFVNVTAGVLDDTWTDGDFSTIEGALDTFWGAIKSTFPAGLVLTEYRWYRVGPGAAAPEPVVRVTGRNVPGTSGGNPLPPQCAVTLSNRTALRKRWGRSYLPHPTVTQVGSNGLLSNGFVDTVGNAYHTFIGALAAADFYPVVYSPTKQRMYTVSRIIVDNVADIQRRRRPEKQSYQNVHGA